MKNKILIFSATFNESENIRDLLNSIDKLNLELEAADLAHDYREYKYHFSPYINDKLFGNESSSC